MKNNKSKNTITTKIVAEFKDQSRAEIRKWRQALEIATDVTNPRQYALQDLYDSLQTDGHLISQINLRKAATTGYGFSIVDKKTGEIIPEKSELFNSEWFYNFVDNVLNSIFRGYTVLELVDPQTMAFNLLPRRNVIGTRQFITFESGGDKGIDFSAGYENTLIHVGARDNIGMLADLCGLLIWKRNAQQSWAEFTERFGMPLISATTNKSSQADIDKINKMLAALGEAAQAVLPEGTTIDIKPFTGGDSYMVYDQQIARINDEISKPIVGGTMISDDGSSRSQSEVHERNLDNKLGETDRRMVQFIVNNQLLPIMNYWGWNINPDTDKFLFDTSFELSLAEHWNIVNSAMQQGYEVDQQWLAKTFNIPITGKHEPAAFGQPVVASLSKNFQ